MIETKRAKLSTSSLDVEARSFDVVASTETIDSHGDIVKQDWKLDRYLQNPVVFFGHESYGLPIGKASDVRVEDGALRMRVTLVSEKANPKAEQVLQLMREDALREVSVGFRPGKRGTEKRDGREVRTLSENELLELSVVGIAANPDARAKDHDSRRPAGRMEARMGMTKALGLAADADETSIEKRFSELAGEILASTGAASLFEVAAKHDALRLERDALKAQAVELEAIKAKLAEEAKAAADAKLVATLDEAVKSGKIAPARRDEFERHARKHGQEWLDALVSNMPALVDIKSASVAPPSTSPEAAAVVIDDELRAQLKRFGLTEEDHIKRVTAQKAG